MKKKNKLFVGLIFTMCLLVGAAICASLGINPLASIGFASGMSYLAVLPTLVLPVDLEAKKTAEVIEHYLKKCGEEIENSGRVSTETKSAMDNLLKKFDDNQEAAKKATEILQASFDTLAVEHKKVIERQAEKKTFFTGVKETLFAKKEEILLAVKNRIPYTIDMKGHSAIDRKSAISQMESNALTGNVIMPYRIPGLVVDPFEEIRIRDFIPIVPITQSSMSYVKQNVVVKGAAAQTEGATKGQSSTTWTEATAPVRTLAVITKVSEQMFDDMPALMGYFQYQYTGELLDLEDQEFLYGSGVAPHIEGFSVVASNYTDYLAISTVQEIDCILNAITQLRLAKYKPNVCFINWADDLRIRTAKDTTGQYVYPLDVRLGGQLQIGGVPVIATTAVTEFDFFVGNFKMAGLIGDRMTPTVVIDRMNDDLEKNMLSIRFEERLALAIPKQQAVVFDTFTNAKAKGSA